MIRLMYGLLAIGGMCMTAHHLFEARAGSTPGGTTGMAALALSILVLYRLVEAKKVSAKTSALICVLLLWVAASVVGTHLMHKLPRGWETCWGTVFGGVYLILLLGLFSSQREVGT